MATWYIFATLMILLSVLVGLYRIFLGPTRADRMLATQLCGTSSAAILLLLAYGLQQYFLCDVALAFSMLASVSTVTFVRFVWQNTAPHDGGLP